MIEWGVATRTLPGETECGDRYVVKPFPGGALVAAVDGLGHGEEAANAARTAVTLLEQHSDESVLSLLRRCHDGLKKTRGVALSLASFSVRESTMTWLGVGNVEGRLLRAVPRADRPQESLLLRGGVVGGELPTPYVSNVAVLPGDVLVFTTDGVRSDFAKALIVGESLQRSADRILAQYGKHTDDALVVVARYARQRH